MINLVKAETYKILGNRWLAGLTLLIWPIGGVLYALVPVLMTLASPDFVSYSRQNPPAFWWESAVLPWHVPLVFFGQVVLIGIAAIAFGSEYSYKTWENLTLHRRRFRLALAKLLALWLGLLLSLVAMSALMTVGALLFRAVLDLPQFPAAADQAKLISDFCRVYLRTVAFSGLTLALILSIGACAAVIGRSAVGGILGGWLFLFADAVALYALYGALARFVAKWFENLQFTRISYSVSMGAYHVLGAPPVLELPQRELSFNVAILTVWLALSLGLALRRLHRQDMT